MTERLYYFDSYRTEFESPVTAVHAEGLAIELARTAFYPTSGGQPHDLGRIAGIPVTNVEETADGRILHHLSSPLAELSPVRGEIDKVRRYDHMRQHTGQHLLSAVMAEHFGLKTVSFHLSENYATVDVEPQAVSPETLREIESAANSFLLENRPVTISFEEASRAAGLRKAPDRDGFIRVITIEDLDRSACGGTHVRQTGEVGLIVLGRTEKIRQALRIEFYCGPRAMAYLQQRVNMAEDALVATREKLAASEKLRRRAQLDLAAHEGRQQFHTLNPPVWQAECEELGEVERARLNAFVAHPGAVALFWVKQTGAILFGAHTSTGIDCNAKLKSVITQFGGRGGGTPALAQGALSDPAKLDAAIAELLG